MRSAATGPGHLEPNRSGRDDRSRPAAGESLTISLDGYAAGPGQGIDNPLGVGGTDLHQWALPTRTFQRALFGADRGTTKIDDDLAARGFTNIGSSARGAR